MGESVFSGVAGGVLVVAAVLKEAPHRPGVPVKITTEFDGVAAFFPSVSVADFVHGIPGMHRGGGEGVADAGVTLRGKPRSAPGVGTAEADPLNAKLADDVVDCIVLRGAIHGETGNRNGYRVQFIWREDMVPSNCGLLRAIVRVNAESRKVFCSGSHSAAGGKAILLAERVAAEERVTVGKIVIDAKRSLILEMSFVANVE